MKNIFTVTLLASCLLFAGTAQAESFSGSVNGVLGNKQLEESDADPRNLGLLGVMADFEFGGFPVRLAADLLLAGRTKEIGGQDVTISTSELGLGGRFNIPTGSNFQPFLGAGVQVTNAYFENDTTDDSDSAVGPYATVGAYYKIIGRINVGGVYRYASADVDFGGPEDFEAGGHYVGIMAGYSW